MSDPHPQVFLSFASRDRSFVELFRDQTNTSRSTLEFRCCSIMEPVSGAWKTHAERLIRHVDGDNLFGRRDYLAK